MKSNVSTSNNYGDSYHNRNDSRLEVNKKGKAFIHMKAKKNCSNDLFVLESSDNKVMVKIDNEGEVFIKGKKYGDNEEYDSGVSNNTLNNRTNGNSQSNNINEINLGSWKIISDGDNLLIQKFVDNEWITKQHFN